MDYVKPQPSLVFSYESRLKILWIERYERVLNETRVA